MTNSIMQKAAAECCGTAALVFIGAGSVPATLMLSDPPASGPSSAQLGLVSFAFMLIIVGLVASVGHLSGCHINPAVTIALAATGGFAWRDVPSYLGAQLAGATAGAFAIAGVLGSQATRLGLGTASYGSEVWGGRALFAEALGAALLTFIVAGAIDRRAAPGRAGVAIGATVFAAVLVVGPVTGGAINPARYLGPMIAAGILGHHESWSQFPIYLTGEFAGALIGALSYLAIARTPAATASRTRVEAHGTPDP
jgi:glycerol uptake facilitator protein